MQLDFGSEPLLVMHPKENCLVFQKYVKGHGWFCAGTSDILGLCKV